MFRDSSLVLRSDHTLESNVIDDLYLPPVEMFCSFCAVGGIKEHSYCILKKPALGN